MENELKQLTTNIDYAFKLVCIDDTSPIEFSVLDDINRGSLSDIYDYLINNIDKYNISHCKWILLPISKNN